MSHRQYGRLLALYGLYCVELGRLPAQVLTMLEEESQKEGSLYFVPEESRAIALAYSQELLEEIQEHKAAIDAECSRHLRGWTWDRLNSLDKNVLRIGGYMLLFDEETPVEVSITEAVELGKTFGEERTSGFINGVLDSVYRHNKGQKTES